MATSKNPGPKLNFNQLGEERSIPWEFIAAMARREEVQSVPNDVGTDALSETLVHSKIETNRENERVKHNVYKKAGPITLLGVKTGREGQTIQVARIMRQTGVNVPTTPATATTKVELRDLGNGQTIEEVEVEGSFNLDGSFTAGVFNGKSFSKSITDNTPLKFRAANPTYDTAETVAGTAVAPTLSSGDLSRSQEQIEDGKVRLKVEYRTPSALPITLVSKRLGQQGQIATVTEKLDNGQQTLTTSFLQIEGSVDNLGDDRSVKTTTTVASFPTLYGYNAGAVADLYPNEFGKALERGKENYRLEIVATGGSATVGAGEEIISSRWLDQDRQEVRIGIRSSGQGTTTLPGGRTGRFGLITEARDLNATSVDTEQDVVSSVVQPAGNAQVKRITERSADSVTPTEREFGSLVNIPGKFRYGQVVNTVEAVVTPSTIPDVGSGVLLSTIKPDTVNSNRAYKATTTLASGNFTPLADYERGTPANLGAKVVTTETIIELADGTAPTAPSLDFKVAAWSIRKLGGNQALQTVTTVAAWPVRKLTEAVDPQAEGDKTATTTTIQAKGTGTTTPGFKTLELRTQELDDERELKIEKLLVGTTFPLLKGERIDEETGGLVTQERQIVDAGGTPLTAYAGGRVFEERRLLDKWKSVYLKTTFALPASWEDTEDVSYRFPTLFYTFTYVNNLGAFSKLRDGFSINVPARVVHSWTATKQTFTPLQIIPVGWSYPLGFGFRDVLTDAQDFVITANGVSATVPIPVSSPTRSGYEALIGTEQLIAGTSRRVRPDMWRNRQVYIIMR